MRAIVSLRRLAGAAHAFRWPNFFLTVWGLGLMCMPQAAAAAPLEVDLGAGLLYFRAHELPTDLPPAATKSGPLVLDLRFASAAESADAALDAWLKFRVAPKTPVFVLVNGSLAEAFQHVLSRYKHVPGLLTIGPKSPGINPDIETKISEDEERKAYTALENGASLESLTRQNADKPRNDEASIMESRTNPPVEDSDVVAEDVDSLADKPAVAPPPPKPVIDVSLQRAIQLHRGLLAFKKIPST